MTKPRAADGDGWTRVRLSVAADGGPDAAAVRAELAADRLWTFGPAAVEERTDDGTVVLLAGFPDRATATGAARAATDAGDGEAVVVAVDDDGLDGWRAWARPVRTGRFLVVPTWLDGDGVPDPTGVGEDGEGTAAADGSAVIRLLVDPVHTFGSGSHPTTRLVLTRLAALVRPGDRVLDVGCGSGILAVAGALLGAAWVEGIDVDDGSPAAVAANAAVNGVGDRVRGSTTPLGEVTERYEVVAANLLAPIIDRLADELAAAVAPGGVLVVSGLLADRWPDGVAPLLAASAGLQVVDVAVEDGWAAITLRP